MDVAVVGGHRRPAPAPPRPLGASVGWHGCVPQCVLQAAEAGSGDGDGAAGAFDVDEGFAFLKLLKPSVVTHRSLSCSTPTALILH